MDQSDYSISLQYGITVFIIHACSLLLLLIAACQLYLKAHVVDCLCDLHVIRVVQTVYLLVNLLTLPHNESRLAVFV